MPSAGGQAVQVTRSGGVYGVESMDGRWLYFLTANQRASISRIPVGGGEEEELIRNVVGYASLAFGKAGLYFLSSITPRNATIGIYDPVSGSNRQALVIDRPVHHFLSSPPDGSSVLYTRIDRQESDLMLRPMRPSIVRNGPSASSFFDH